MESVRGIKGYTFNERWSVINNTICQPCNEVLEGQTITICGWLGPDWAGLVGTNKYVQRIAYLQGIR